MIKLIIFDFGGVIGCDSNEWQTTFKIIPQLTGLLHHELDALFYENWPKLKIGSQTMKNFWQQVSKKSKRKVSYLKLRKAYQDSVSANPKMIEFVKKISQKYNTVILMNESDDGGKAKINKFKLNKIVNKVYNSAEIGVGKPDKEAFLMVLKDQKVKKDEVIFIDNQENNLETASLLGIKNILFKNLTQVKKELLPLLAN